MAENDTDLPEGTDKIIAGASAPTGSGTTAAASVTSADDDELLIATDTELAEIGGDADVTDLRTGTGARAGTGGADLGSGDDSVIGRLRSGGKDLTGQAAGKARDLVGQGLERGAEALANVGRMIGDTAAGLDERLGEEYGDYARRAAAAIEDTASSIAAKDADELIDDTRDFVRKSPGVALAGAAIVGFALARLIKTGFTGTEGSDEGRDPAGGRSRRSNRSSRSES
ncbi:MAG TPA: hypothetical protein VM265_07205 [Sphingomicrobium sp.]|nr:hypothetical protein [Sphingomicrobium sp.]